MAWAKSTGTRHTCGGPAFGRLTAGCLRCDELATGAQPRAWANSRRDDDRRRAAEIAAHFSGQHHLSGGCGPVCTFGEW
jgi:hypothetical protein